MNIWLNNIGFLSKIEQNFWFQMERKVWEKWKKWIISDKIIEENGANEKKRPLEVG